MRLTRQTSDGRWYTVDDASGLTCLGPPDWHPDATGHWPRLDVEVRSLGTRVPCPSCGNLWVFEEMDCVFGRACRDDNDVLILFRCGRCRLPHRIRAVGLVTAYPRIVRLMSGWSDWARRRHEFATEETHLFGESIEH